MNPRNSLMRDTSYRPRSNRWLQIKYWIPVFLYCSLIFFLSSQSNPTRYIPTYFAFPFSDKLVHGVEYGLLGILLYQAFKHTSHTIRSVSLAIICALAFGISDEIHQWFVPHRHADMWDVLADAIGAIFFIVVWIFLSRLYRSCRHPQQN
jgi:VanZ family protein